MVIVQAALDEWIFIAVVITGSATDATKDELQLYVGDEDLDNYTPSATAEIPQGNTHTHTHTHTFTHIHTHTNITTLKLTRTK